MNTSKNPHPRVSIIIPVYNTAQYLSECLDSIIHQTYKNLEIIIINDGSTDASMSIIKRIAKKDHRIKYINQKNQGQSAARNLGLKYATGQFISFIDSDDKVNRFFIQELVKPFLEDPNTSLTVCGIHYKRIKQNESKNVYTHPIRKHRKHESKKAYILYLLTIDGRLYSSVNKLFYASIAKKISFDESLNFAEDTKFVLEYLNKTNGKISFVLKPLYTYNYGTEISTIHHTATSWLNWEKSYNNLKKWLGKHPTIEEQFWLYLIHLRWRISYLRSKRHIK